MSRKSAGLLSRTAPGDEPNAGTNVPSLVTPWYDAPFRWMDRNYISRRIALFVTLWITVDSYAWAKHFAESARQTDSIQVPAIIAAVLAAVSGLQGWVFKLYLNGSPKDQE